MKSKKKTKVKIDVKEIFPQRLSIGHKLVQTWNVEDFDDENITEILKHLYKNKTRIFNQIGTLFNGLFVHQKVTFMITFRMLETLILNDENISEKTFSARDYKAIMHYLLGNKIAIVLREPTGRRAGIYKVISDQMLKVFYQLQTKDFFKAQEADTLKIRDEVPYELKQNNEDTLEKIFVDEDE
jgi:hypothetical protein